MIFKTKYIKLLLFLGLVRRKNILLKIDKDEFENLFFNKVEYINLWTGNDFNFKALTSSKKYKGQFFPNEFVLYDNSSLLPSRDNSHLSINGYYWYFENGTKIRLTVKAESLLIALDFVFIPISIFMILAIIYGEFTTLPFLIAMFLYRFFLYFKIKKLFSEITSEINIVNIL